MKHAIAAVLTAVVFGACVAAARADSPSQVVLKAGAFVQTNAGRNTNGIFAAGGEYIVHQGSTLQPFDVSVYADLFGGSGGAGVSIRNSGNAYIGAGAGLYHVSLTPPPGGAAGPFGSSPQTTYTASGLGGKVFAGFALHEPVGLEFAYHFLPNPGPYQTGALTAELTLHL
jgi:hypothetical protein